MAFRGWLLLFQTAIWILRAHGLEPVNVTNGRFLLKDSRRELRPNGVTYVLPNWDPSYANRIDPLSDAVACVRDAALLQRLGVNAIAVANISTAASHDECMSVFDYAGIYVAIDCADSGDSYLNRPAVSLDYMDSILECINAFQNYPNTLAFNVGFVNYDLRFPNQQPLLRALVRNSKNFIKRYSPRKDIPVGFALYNPLFTAPPKTWLKHVMYYASCIDQKDPDAAADFIALPANDFVQDEFNVAPRLEDWTYHEVFSDWSSFEVRTPLLLWAYRNYQSIVVSSTNFNTTQLLFDESLENVLADSIVGGFVDSWIDNLNRGMSSEGLVRVNGDGSVLTRPGYDRLRRVLEEIDVDKLRASPVATAVEGVSCVASAVSPTQIIEPDVYNSTALMTLLFNTSWDLPTPIPAVASRISSGVTLPMGSIVSVTDTAVPQTIRNAQGDVISDITLTQFGFTTQNSASPSSDPFPSAPSSKLGLKIGLGISIPLFFIGSTLGAIVLFRRRGRRLRAALELEGHSKALPEMPGSGQLFPHEFAGRDPAELFANELYELPGSIAELPEKPN